MKEEIDICLDLNIERYDRWLTLSKDLRVYEISQTKE